MKSPHLEEMQKLHSLKEDLQAGRISERNLTFEISRLFGEASKDVLAKVLGIFVEDRLVEIGVRLESIQGGADVQHDHSEPGEQERHLHAAG